MKKLIQISIKTLALAALLLLLALPAEAQRSQRNPYMPFPSANMGGLNSSFSGDASSLVSRMPDNRFSPAFPVNPFGDVFGGGNDNPSNKLNGIVCFETGEACLGTYSFPSSHEVNVNKFFIRVDLVFNGNTNGVSISADLDVQYLQGGNDVELLDFVWQIDRLGDENWETLSESGKSTTLIANTVDKKIRLRYAPKLIQVSNMQETGCGRKGISVQPVFNVISIS